MVFEISGKNLKVILYTLFIGIFTILFSYFFSINTSNKTEAQTCPDGCYWNSGVSHCVGSGGCVLRDPVCSCYSTETCLSGYCCANGVCVSCTPAACDAYYTETNTGCATSNKTCTKQYCTGTSCGTNTRYCYLVEYILTYSAGTGGYISGTTPQEVCRGSNGTQVTAVANAGYAFEKWSDDVLTASRTDTAVYASKTVTATFYLLNQAPTAPTGLTTETLTDPIGVTDTTPEFQATYNDPNTSDTAIYYEIEVNTNNTFTGTVMWDTGKLPTSVTEGSRSPDYTYAGVALSENGTTYYWRIRFWDTDDLQGDWSATNTFVSNFNHQTFKGLQLKGLQLK